MSALAQERLQMQIFLEQQDKEKKRRALTLKVVREELTQYSVSQALTTDKEIKEFFETYIERYSIDKLWDKISQEAGRLQSKRKNAQQPVLRLIAVKNLPSHSSCKDSILFQVIFYDYLSKKIQINEYRLNSIFQVGNSNINNTGYRVHYIDQGAEATSAGKMFVNLTALFGDFLDNGGTPTPFATTVIAVPKSSLQTIISTISGQELNDLYVNVDRDSGTINKPNILKKLNAQLEWCRSVNSLNRLFVSIAAHELNNYFSIPEILSLISEYLGDITQSAREDYEENRNDFIPSSPFLTMLYKRSLIPQPSAAPSFSTASATIANTATGVVSTSITPTIP